MDTAAAPERRYFPPITERLYTHRQNLDFPFQPARVRDAFQFSHASADARFRRILAMHRQAFAAELEAAWERAGFYWKELWRLVLSAGQNDHCWKAGRTMLFPSAADLTDGEFRNRFVKELLLDSHAGFFRGLVEAGLDPLDRPKFHLDGISRLITSLPDMSAEEEAVRVDGLALVAVESYRRRELADDLELFWHELAARFPRQTRYVNAELGEIHTKTMRQIHAAADSGKLAITGKAIESVESIRRTHPTNLGCYQLLGLFYHEQAILFANAQSIPSALLALKKAVAFGGLHPVLVDTQRQLDEIVAAMQQAATRLKEALLQRPGSVLTPQGTKLVYDARTASRLATDWDTSQAAGEVRAEREIASQAQTVETRPGGNWTAPQIRIEATTQRAGDAPLPDFLNSPAGMRLKFQVLAAVALVLVTAGLLIREAWGSYARRQAWDKVEVAMNSHNDTGLLDALADFFGAPTPSRSGPESRAAAARLYGDALVRWLSTKSGALSSEDRKRVQRYRKQIVDRGLYPQGEVAQ
jgi:hypothetical protein